MNINRTFSIPEHTVRDLNRQVRNQSRSEFVAKAIRNRLDGENSFDLYEISISELVFHLCCRSELGKSHKVILENIYKEMKE